MKKMMIIALIAGIFLIGCTSFERDEGHILNIAHRGASGYAPEHTIVSYEIGERMEGDYIEIDLQMTKDGELIAMHDDKVDRTTNGTGFVKDKLLKEIKELDAGSWFNEMYPKLARDHYVGAQVPTLEEIFRKFGIKGHYYIETKSPDLYPGMEKELLRLVNYYKIDKRKLLIQSFSRESLLILYELDPALNLIQLYSYSSDAIITDEEITEVKKYAIGIGPNHTYLTKEYVQKVVNSGLEIHPYTINDKERMVELIEWGVTGIFTNFPKELHEVILQSKKTPSDHESSCLKCSFSIFL